MNTLATINLDMLQPGYVTVHAVQDDKLSRQITANLLSGGTAWTIPSGALMTIRYSKPDGTAGYYDSLENGGTAYTVASSRQAVTITLAQQALSVAGNVNVQLNFYTSSGAQLSSFSFRVDVEPAVYTDESIVSSDYYNVLTATMTQIAQDMAAWKAGYGAPLTATTAAGMTDQSKIYVYTGTTSGSMVNGHWYYYNGTVWTDGGVYNSTAFETDPTLTISGAAADAKATGDAVTNLNNSLDSEIIATSVLTQKMRANMWRVGYISPTTGQNATGSISISFIATRFIDSSMGVSQVRTKEGYKLRAFAYQPDGTFVGVWVGNGFEKTWNRYETRLFNVVAYPMYKFRIEILRDDEADMTTAEYTNLEIWYSRFAEDGLMVKLQRGNLANDTTKVRGYLTQTGSIGPATEVSARETTTDYIPVEEGATYYVTLFVDETAEYWGRVCLYDANKTYTTRNDYSTPTGQWMNFNYAGGSITIPAGSKFIRVSQRHGFSLVTKGNTEYDYMPSAADVRRHWSLRPKQDYFVKSINHRGYRRVAPENTAPAFELSADLGFWGAENDIRFTADGVPVLLHDETINRTARNADGSELASTISIADITYAEALTYDFGIWMGAEYAGTRILSFADFVKLCRRKSLHCYNEIKSGTKQQTQALVDTVVRNGMKDFTTWLSYSAQYLNNVLEKQPTARVGLIVSTIGQSEIDSLISLKTADNSVFVDVDTNNMPTEAVIETLIENGIALEVYTPNFTTTINSIDPYVTGMTSDYCIAGDCLYFDANNILIIK